MIDAVLYINSLPTFRPKSEEMAKDLRGILETRAMKEALATLEEQALLLEKQFIGIDFISPDGAMRAMELKEKISGLRAATEMLISLANGDEDGTRDNDHGK